MEMSLFEIWESMSLLSRLVAISLLGMGVASFAVIIEQAPRRSLKRHSDTADR